MENGKMDRESSPGAFSGAMSSFSSGVSNMHTQLRKEMLARVKWECWRDTIWEDLKKPPELKPRMQVEAIRTT